MLVIAVGHQIRERTLFQYILQIAKTVFDNLNGWHIVTVNLAEYFAAHFLFQTAGPSLDTFQVLKTQQYKANRYLDTTIFLDILVRYTDSISNPALLTFAL